MEFISKGIKIILGFLLWILCVSLMLGIIEYFEGKVFSFVIFILLMYITYFGYIIRSYEISNNKREDKLK